MIYPTSSATVRSVTSTAGQSPTASLDAAGGWALDKKAMAKCPHCDGTGIDPTPSPDGIVMDVVCGDCRVSSPQVFALPWPDGVKVTCEACGSGRVTTHCIEFTHPLLRGGRALEST